eukprot:scaffold1875_cov339-Prasinococcus_capsulatus_cf.AAC.20
MATPAASESSALRPCQPVYPVSTRVPHAPGCRPRTVTESPTVASAAHLSSSSCVSSMGDIASRLRPPPAASDRTTACRGAAATGWSAGAASRRAAPSAARSQARSSVCTVATVLHSAAPPPRRGRTVAGSPACVAEHNAGAAHPQRATCALFLGERSAAARQLHPAGAARRAATSSCTRRQTPVRE